MTVQVSNGPGTSTYTSNRVTATVNGSACYVYKWSSTQRNPYTLDVAYGLQRHQHWVKFGADETTTVELTLIDGTGPVTTFELSGNLDEISATIVSGKLRLTCPAGSVGVRVDLNGNHQSPIYVWPSSLAPSVPGGSITWADYQTANPGAQFIPDGTSLHFPAGEWYVGWLFFVGNNCTITLDRDAVVTGNWAVEDLLGDRKQNIVFQGGNLGWPQIDPYTAGTVTMPYSEAVLYSLFVTPTGPGLDFWSEIEVKGCTIFGVPFHLADVGIWNWEDCQHLAHSFGGIGDSFRCSPRLWTNESRRTRCYSEAGDDAFVTFPFSNHLDTKCVVGTTLNACWNYLYHAFPDRENPDTGVAAWNLALATGCYAYHRAIADNDTDEGYPSKGDQAILAARCDASNAEGEAGWGRYGFQVDGLRVTGPIESRFLWLRNEPYPYDNGLASGSIPARDSAGNIARAAFRNITLDEEPGQLSYIWGRDALNTPHDLEFENLDIGGTAVNPDNWSDYFVQNEFPYNIFIDGEEYMAFTLDFSGLSYRIYTSDGSASTYPIVIDYLEESHLIVRVNGVTKTAGTHYNITSGSVVFTSGNIPAAGAQVKINRVTPREYANREVDFKSFGSITEDQMDLDQKQTWLLIQEAIETTDTGDVDPEAEYPAWDPVSETWSALRDGNPQRIADVAEPEQETDVATKGYVDAIAEWGVAGVPQSWEFTANGLTTDYSLTGGESIDPDYLVVSIDGEMLSPISDFTTNKGSPDTKLTFTVAPAAAAKISVQNFGKARFVNTLVPGANSVSTAALQEQAVTTQKLADLGVSSAKLAEGAVTGTKLAQDAVTTSRIADGSITLAKLAEVFVDAPGGTNEPLILGVEPDDGTLIFRRLTLLDIEGFVTELANVPLSTFANPTIDRNMGGKKVTNLGAPSSSSDAATKAYVDTQVGAATGSKVDLVFQNSLGTTGATWTWFDSGTQPAGWTDSTYLYYTVVIHNLKASGSVSFAHQRNGVWENPNSHVALAMAANTPKIVQGLIMPTRTPYSDRQTYAWLGASFGTEVNGVNFPITGLRMTAAGTITAGATVQIYGHKTL